MHWLGPFMVAEIKDFWAVRLAKLDGIMLPGWVNGARLKPFHNPKSHHEIEGVSKMSPQVGF